MGALVYQWCGDIVTWWDQAHGPWFLSQALDEYVHVQALAEKGNWESFSNTTNENQRKVQCQHSHLHYFIKRFHVLLHAVMGAQVGHKVARVHAIKTVEE